MTKPEIRVIRIRMDGIERGAREFGRRPGFPMATLGETDEADARERLDAYNLRREREARTIFLFLRS